MGSVAAIGLNIVLKLFESGDCTIERVGGDGGGGVEAEKDWLF